MTEIMSIEIEDSESLNPLSEKKEELTDNVKHSKAPTSTEAFEKLKSEIDACTDTENKLQKALDFMSSALAQEGSPHFKNFWEARKLCTNLFKENLNPNARTNYWNKYNELTIQARNLKQILEEQSSFAIEQIEIAINALEKELNNIPESVKQIPPVQFPECKAINNSINYYTITQRELNLLNTYASRINALRKELTKTLMRIRQKNQFFQKLSACGDKVFPIRKQLIGEISQKFISEIETFINTHFKPQINPKASAFLLRDEIKALQTIAKILTLNTYAFSQSREKLTEAWEKLKLFEKEQKKARNEQQEQTQKIVSPLEEKIKEFGKIAHEISLEEGKKQIDEIEEEIKNSKLDRNILKQVRKTFSFAQKPFQTRLEFEEKKRMDEEKTKKAESEQKKKEIEAFCDTLLDQIKGTDQATINAKIEELKKYNLLASLNENEKNEVSFYSQYLELLLEEFTHPDEKLEIMKDRKVLLKKQIDCYRKLSGSSGLDIEQSFKYSTRIQKEKIRLQELDDEIAALE